MGLASSLWAARGRGVGAFGRSRRRGPVGPTANPGRADSASRTDRLARAARLAVEPLEDRTLFAFTVVDLGSLDNTTSDGYAVNATGQAALNSGAIPKGVLASGGSLTPVGTFGGAQSVANGINASGLVVGSAQDNSANSNFIAYSFDGSTLRNLGTLGGAQSFATAVNDSGMIVGNSFTTTEVAPPQHGFVFNNGTMTDIGTLGGVTSNFSEATGINNNGQVTGSSFITSGAQHAFLRTGSTLKDLGTLGGGSSSRGLGINDAGQVVGVADTSASGNPNVAFFYDGTTMTALGTLSGDAASTANDINNVGQVVGFSADDNNSGNQLAFLYTAAGGMVDLNSQIPANSGWVLRNARSINDNGQIVGVGTFNGVQRAFLLNPSGVVTPGSGPTATVAATPPADGATSAVVTVTYADDQAVSVGSIDGNDVTVTGPGGAALTVSLVSTAPTADAASIVATYAVAAPGGTWDSADNGTYTVAVAAGQVTDTSGNAGSAATGSFVFGVPGGTPAGPAAQISPVEAVTTAGATSGSVSVIYEDSATVASLGVDDLTITGPNGLSATVNSFSHISNTDGGQLLVLYTFTPPGGSWDAADNGTYAVSIAPGAVTDAQGNPTAGATASFLVNIPEVRPTVDPAFNGGAPLSAGFVAESSVTSLDGRTYVVGHQGSAADGSLVGVIRRLNADGSPDGTFGGGTGQVTTVAGNNDAFYNVALEPTGKFVVVSGARGDNFLVARYAIKGGKLDGKFGDKGAATLDLGNTGEIARGLAVGADGSVYFGGASGEQLVVQKLTAKGQPDAVFGLDGQSILPGQLGSDVTGLAVQPDNAVVVAGGLSGQVFATRLLADGTIDPAFNGGVVATPAAFGTLTVGGGDDTPVSRGRVGLALQSDGKVLLADKNLAGDFVVVRLDAAGNADASFSGDGVATADFGGTDDADSVAVQGTGQIAVVGMTTTGGTVRTAVAVFDSAGNLATGFDDDGLATLDSGASDATAPAQAVGTLQPNGKMLILASGASAAGSSGLLRVNVPGSGSLGPVGIVNGKAKPVTFADTDGTLVTVTIKGAAGTALYDGSAVDLALTGTSLGTTIAFKTKGGDGRVRVGDVRTDGALKSVTGKTADVAGTFYVNGELRAVSLGTLSGTLAAAGNLGTLAFANDLAGAKVLAGANLGADAAIGGGDDAYGAAVINKLTVNGTVAASVVGAGFDPVDGDFFNGGTVAGGAASALKALTVKRSVDGASRFFAGAFSKSVKIPQKIIPATDPRFVTL